MLPQKGPPVITRISISRGTEVDLIAYSGRTTSKVMAQLECHRTNATRCMCSSRSESRRVSFPYHCSRSHCSTCSTSITCILPSIATTRDACQCHPCNVLCLRTFLRSLMTPFSPERFSEPLIFLSSIWSVQHYTLSARKLLVKIHTREKCIKNIERNRG